MTKDIYEAMDKYENKEIDFHTFVKEMISHVPEKLSCAIIPWIRVLDWACNEIPYEEK